MSRYLIILTAGLAFGLSPKSLSADTIKLEGGGTIRGQIVEEKSTKDVLVIKLQVGGREVTFNRKAIQEIIPGKDATEEYEEIKGEYEDTAEHQFKLALWCEEHKLARQRRTHLLRVIELDPEHVQAHEKLGYLRRDGKWLSPQEQKEAKGLVRFGGRYVTPQEKEILEQKKREDSTVREWHTKVRMWKAWLTGNDSIKVRQADDQLRNIEDPRAIDAVVAQFGKENSESLRILMCDILGNIPGEQATIELVRRCLSDVSPSVRWAAVEKLVERQDPLAVRTLIHFLQSDYNAIVRRAAEALGGIGDPTAVPALIAALVTKHKQVVTRSAPGGFFGSSNPVVVDHDVVVGPGVMVSKPIVVNQPSGFSIGGVREEVEIVEVPNEEVLQALRLITKEDFGYHQATWRQWYASQVRKEEVKKRRQIEDR